MKRGDFCSRGICALTLILSFLWIPTTGQLLVPVTAPGATPKPTSSSLGPSSCNYLISRTNGVCMVTTSAVDRQLNAIKDDNFRARLQFMSQNSVLQSQISKIESDDVKLSLRVDGLQRDLQALRSRVSTTAPGAPTGSANINQLRTTLQQSIQGVDNRVTGLAAAYQRDAVSQAQTNAAFQQQLTQLLQDNQQLTINNNRLTQELQRLSTQMQTLATGVRQAVAGAPVPTLHRPPPPPLAPRLPAPRLHQPQPRPLPPSTPPASSRSSKTFST
ncbi:hypothetical protein EGW08_004217 [Elysia chlorotica]|uniref:Uncharacterized protein n=1 Tax=Elysia chlorotica TaxID=188477 RepID=A0A3S0ZWX4_ELYCH|nr:hypothetical protein EGW08_004217 [Elysia chlorotica]